MSGEVAAFRQVSKSYGKVKAVNGLDLTLYPGQTVALLGPNGAGKSSSLDLLLGLREPDQGTVTLFGGSPRAAIEAGRVGAMLQSGGLMSDVKVRELVQLACDVHPRGHKPAEVLREAGIEEIADRRVDKLSGGQEQRVRFALAIAGANDLIVLDEPTTGMDVSVRQQFWAAMRAQADQGRTVLFATHYLEEADSIADRVLVLHRGRLLADGSSADIKAWPAPAGSASNCTPRTASWTRPSCAPCRASPHSTSAARRTGCAPCGSVPWTRTRWSPASTARAATRAASRSPAWAWSRPS